MHNVSKYFSNTDTFIKLYQPLDFYFIRKQVENFTFEHDKCHYKQKWTMTDHSITRDSSPASFPSSVLQQQKQIQNWSGKDMCTCPLETDLSPHRYNITTQPSLGYLPLQILTASQSYFQQKQAKNNTYALGTLQRHLSSTHVHGICCVIFRC